MLASDSLTKEQRARVIENGLRFSTVRDANLLSVHEADLIQQYRQMGAAGRQAIRVVFARVARASSNAQADEGEKAGGAR